MSATDFMSQLPQIVSAAIMLLVAGIVLFNAPAKEYGRPFALLLTLIALYTVGIMVGNSTKTIAPQIIAHTTAVVLLLLAVPAWLIFITHYSGFGRWITPAVRRIIWAVSSIFAIIMAFNHWLEWLFDVQYINNDPNLTTYSYAPFAYICLAYTFVAMVYGLILFWFAISKSRGVFRRQFVFMMLGVLLLVTSVVVTFFLTPGSDLSLIMRPTFNILAGIAFLLGIFLSRLFSVVPISRRTFFEQVQTGFVACDEAGRIIDVNPAAVTLFGNTLSQLIGQHYAEAFTVFSEPLDCALFTAVEPTQHEHQLKPNGDTSARWFNIEAAPIHAQGDRRGTSLILRDITQEKESKTLRDTLNRMIYHDLSQPVESIMFAVPLAKHAYETQNHDKQEQYLGAVEEASERLLTMMKTLQTINRSKMQSLQLNVMEDELNHLITQTIEMHSPKAQAKRITLAQETPPIPTLISMDVDLIFRVLGNLVSNGMRFTPEGGRILIKLQTGTETVSVSVIDNGIGLQTDDHDHLFKEGVSIGKKRSSGLGLAFCRMVVEAHSGRIQFDPVPTGTSVTFTLPTS